MFELCTFTLTDIDSGNVILNIYVNQIAFFSLGQFCNPPQRVFLTTARAQKHISISWCSVSIWFAIILGLLVVTETVVDVLTFPWTHLPPWYAQSNVVNVV